MKENKNRSDSPWQQKYFNISQISRETQRRVALFMRLCTQRTELESKVDRVEGFVAFSSLFLSCECLAISHILEGGNMEKSTEKICHKIEGMEKQGYGEMLTLSQRSRDDSKNFNIFLCEKQTGEQEIRVRFLQNFVCFPVSPMVITLPW